MKTILVTGAAGFIGRRMMAAAQAAGWHVIGLDREVLRTAKPEKAAPPPSDGIPPATVHSAPSTGWLLADLTADTAIELPAGIDAIIHLAGKAHALAEVAQDEAEYFRINTEGTRRMLEAAQRAGVRAFVLFSTVKAAGDSGDGGERTADDGERTTEDGGRRTEVLLSVASPRPSVVRWTSSARPRPTRRTGNRSARPRSWCWRAAMCRTRWRCGPAWSMGPPRRAISRR